MQILILGAHYSGAAAVVNYLKCMGIDQHRNSNDLPFTAANPNVFDWANKAVADTNDWVLESTGCRWDCPSVFDPQRIPRLIREEFHTRAEKILRELDQHRPWAVNDPLLCITLPLWQSILASPVCIIVNRNPRQIAESMYAELGYPTHIAVALWEQYLASALYYSDTTSRLIVDYDAATTRPIETFAHLYYGLKEFAASDQTTSSSSKTYPGLATPRQYCTDTNNDCADFQLTENQSRLARYLTNGDEEDLNSVALESIRMPNLAFTDHHQKLGFHPIPKHLEQTDPQFKELANADRPLIAPVSPSGNAQSANDLDARCATLERELAERDQEVAELQVELACRNRDAHTAMRYFEQLSRDVQAILDSLTWKIGLSVANSARKLSLAPVTPLAQDHVAKLVASYSIWKRARLDHNQTDQADGITALVNSAISADSNESSTLRKTPNSSIGLSPRDQLERIEILEDELAQWRTRPTFSIVMPVFNIEKRWLEAAVNSVKSQMYPYWQLCIADDGSTRSETIRYLKSLNDSRITVTMLHRNLGISAASNAALALATGEFLVLLDHDDELTPDALLEVARAIDRHDPDLIYSDEDKIGRNGDLLEPHYKPDFSPDMIFSQNYISHLGVYRKEIIDKIGGFRSGFEGSQDYDLVLRFLEHTDRVHHVSKVLYHWRQLPGSTSARSESKPYAWVAGRKALQEAVQRRALEGFVDFGNFSGTYRVKRRLRARPLVSIIIPFRDQPDLLDAALTSILAKSTYDRFEVIGVNNDSTMSATHELVHYYQNLDDRITFLDYDAPFNFSAINNYAANIARGEHLILLNNDVTVITPDWIEALLEHSQRPEVGAVGALLYYPDDTIQHAGVIIGLGGIAGHSHAHFPKGSGGYFARPYLIQNLSAVTGACLMVKKTVYDEAGGLDEKNLPIAFNDVDFCLRLRERNLLNVYTPYCEMYHHESRSRGPENTRRKQARFAREVGYIRDRHARILEDGDPYYNINLTLNNDDFSIRNVA